jgi:hypothetical protein
MAIPLDTPGERRDDSKNEKKAQVETGALF